MKLFEQLTKKFMIRHKKTPELGLRVKICGITQPEQGQAIAQLGASALGFICVPVSPRYVTPEQIQAITAQVPSECDRIGVFVNADLATIVRTAAIGNLTGVQLHGHESPDVCLQVRQALPQVEILKALRVRNADTLKEAAIYYPYIDTLLLDAYHPHLAGGTGLQLDWQILQSFQPQCPWLLAGGLTPENVLTAVQRLHPSGIDLSSGVERVPGDKDLAQVAKLFQHLNDHSLTQS
jgi:phosphoribosylanthranilate isomerase